MKVKDEAFKANQENELTLLSNIWFLISRYATLMQFHNVFHTPSEPVIAVGSYCARTIACFIALPFVQILKDILKILCRCANENSMCVTNKMS